MAPLAIDEHEGVVGGQAAQARRPYDAGRVPDRLGIHIEGRDDGAQQVAQVGVALFDEVPRRDGVDGDGGLGGGAGAGPAAERDAAGCQADTGSSPDAFAANLWTLSEREVRIGSVDDPGYAFGPITHLSAGPDGLLYTMHWGEGAIRRWTPDGAPAGSVGREGEGPGEFQRAAGMGFFGDSLPFEPRDVFAIMSDDGGSFSSQPFGDGYIPSTGENGLLVIEHRAWTGNGEAAVKVTKIGLDGDTLFTAAVPYDPVPLPSERYDSAVAVIVDQWRNRQFSASEADIRKAMYRPSYLPALRGITQAEDGTIWLRRYDPVESETGEQMTEWWVLDAEGSPLARAETPAGLSLRVINGDTVWGVERDELDVEYFVRYRLAKDG